jgi:hypothetical protein
MEDERLEGLDEIQKLWQTRLAVYIFAKCCFILALLPGVVLKNSMPSS